MICVPCILTRCRAAAAILLAMNLAACQKPDQGRIKAEAIKHGEALIAAQRYREAAGELRKAVAIDPGDGPLRLLLANTHERAQQWNEASLEAIRAADLLPENTEAQLLAGRLMLPLGRFPEVIDRMTRLLAKDANSTTAMVILGTGEASLINSTWALFRLQDAIRDPSRFNTERATIRTVTPQTNDIEAEKWLRRAVAQTPDSADAQLALANFFWATGRENESEALLRAALDRDSQNQVTTNALAGLLVSRGRTSEGEALLKKQAIAGPGGRTARFALVDLYHNANRDKEAIALLATMGEDDDRGDVSMKGATIELAAGNARNALGWLDPLLARDSRNAGAWELKARVFLTDGQTADAVKAARAAIDADSGSSDAHTTLGRALISDGDFPGALAAYREASRLNPRAHVPRIEAARLSLSMGHPDQALDYAQDAAALAGDDRAAALTLASVLIAKGNLTVAAATLAPWENTAPNAADVLIRVAELAAARGNAAQARAAYERALAADPAAVDAMLGLAVIDADQQRNADARRRIEAIPRAQQRNPAVARVAARVYSAAKDDARLEIALRRLIEIDPRDVKTQLALHALLVRQRRSSDATSVLAAALEQNPESVDLRLASAAALERAGKIAEARDTYQGVVREQPGRTDAAIRLAVIYADRNENLEDALRMALRAAALSSRDPAAADAVGWVYVRQHLARQGLRYLLTAVEAAPQQGSYHFHLAKAYEALEDTGKARTHFAEALRLEPEAAFAEDARARVSGKAR